MPDLPDIATMTKDEQSLLLFLETCAVDHAGRVNVQHMNAKDMDSAQRWNKSGFVRFGRIVAADASRYGSHWCELSEPAWVAAHQYRKDRAARMLKARAYVRTENKNDDPIA